MDKTEHNNDETALATSGDTTTDPSVAELEKHVADLAASPHFIPLMGSFRDLLEAERRRNRLRTLILGGGIVLVLALFIWGPFHTMRLYIEQSEQRMAAERQSLERVEQALNNSMTVLAEASRDLRTTLEAYRQLPGPATTPATLPAPVPVILPAAVPAVVPAELPTNAAPLPPPAPVVAAAVAPAATATGAVETIAATVTNPPPSAPEVPPDLLRALSSTPAVPPPAPPPTNQVTSLPRAATEKRLTDTLADVERAIQSIRERRAALTNATGNATP
jgi:hypothetical protein